MVIAYRYDGTLYLAVTRRCTLGCVFCPKVHGRWRVAGNDLSSDREPAAAELLAAAEAAGLERGGRVAFVGLGEPTLRLDVVIAVGRQLRLRGQHVRLVTDGLANLREGVDVTGRLSGALDEVSVSLNAADPQVYARLCPSRYGAAAHPAAVAFVGAVRQAVPSVVVTALDLPEADVEGCRRIAAGLGVRLRVRPYFDPLTGEPHAQQTPAPAPSGGR